MRKDEENNYILDKEDLKILCTNIAGSRKKLKLVISNLEKSYAAVEKKRKEAHQRFNRTLVELNKQISEQTFELRLQDVREKLQEKKVLVLTELTDNLSDIEEHLNWANSLLDLMDYCVRKEYVKEINAENQIYGVGNMKKAIIPEECDEEVVEQILAGTQFIPFIDMIHKQTEQLLINALQPEKDI